ncbi:hypothetical protein [Edaphobacter acidisoli]|uniref:hypothetical protein n=1 Tax=Edaphobacter acidisoli TaxID=2040573 RepID=UPI00166BC7D9|nr:hypothetical protein [Edaphobacter acidisoli]
MNWSLAISFCVTTLLWVAAFVLLLINYIRTRNIGFIWLGASFLWSRVAVLADRQLFRKPEIGISLTIMNAISLLEEAIGMALLLTAIIYLGRSQPSNQASAIKRD